MNQRSRPSNPDSAAAAAARDLRARFGPDRVLMPGPAYDQARRPSGGKELKA